MAGEVVGTGQIEEALLESGKITDDMSVEDIQALIMAEQSGGAAATETPANQDPQAQDPPAAAAQQQPTQDPPAQQQQAQDPAAEVPAPIETRGGSIPYSVLQGTRRQRDEYAEQLRSATAALDKLREDNERRDREMTQLRQQLETQQGSPSQSQQQQAQDILNRAGVTDANGNPIDIAKIDITQFRGAYPDEIVNLMAAMQHGLLNLTQREAQRGKHEQLTAEQQEQLDIDTVPEWAQWQADPSDKMWRRANAMYNVIRAEPENKGKSRVELFQEVARVLSPTGQTASGKQPVSAPKPSTPGTTVQQAIQRAAAAAMPISHSDLPAGQAPAQSEAEGLEGLDTAQLAERMQDPVEMERLLARYG